MTCTPLSRALHLSLNPKRILDAGCGADLLTGHLAKYAGRLLLLTTEDRWTGKLTSRVWNCRTHNRQRFRRLCHEHGLVWKQELSFSTIHRRLGIGGICVEIGRQEVPSVECRRYHNNLLDDAGCPVST